MPIEENTLANFKGDPCPYEGQEAYYAIRPTPAPAPQLGFWAGFPRLSTTVPRHLSATERGAALIVFGFVCIMAVSLPALLVLMVWNSPMWRGWTW